MITNAERAAARRSYAGPALFSFGFRPFFLLAGLWAPAVLVLSLWMMWGDAHLPVAWAPVDWHIHEMLFGYLAAAIAGFVLTAVPNWTGRLPVNGWPLAGLVVLWIAGRVGVCVSDWIGPWATAGTDLVFLAALAFLAAREIGLGGNWRNLPIVAAIVLLLAANALFHAELAGLSVVSGVATRLGIAVVTLLVALVGGRIVPSFTRNWLAGKGVDALPAAFGWFDKAALVLTLFALGLWTVVPGGPASGILLALAGLANAVRLARWQGLRTGGEPLVGVLHLGFLWIPVGLALLAAAAVSPDGRPEHGLPADHPYRTQPCHRAALCGWVSAAGYAFGRGLGGRLCLFPARLRSDAGRPARGRAPRGDLKRRYCRRRLRI